MEAQKGGKRRLVLGIFAQVDAGKTTLSEALLYKTGALRTLGRVDRGDAHLDTHELERARGITIFSKQARFETERLAVTLLDTPAMPILRRRPSASCPSSTARCCSSAARTACRATR